MSRQSDLFDGVYDDSKTGYRFKFIAGRLKSEYRKRPTRVDPPMARSLGMRGAWGKFPDLPETLRAAVAAAESSTNKQPLE